MNDMICYVIDSSNFILDLHTSKTTFNWTILEQKCRLHPCTFGLPSMNTSHVESHICHVVQMCCKTLSYSTEHHNCITAASSFVYAFLTHGRKNVSVLVKMRALSSSSVSRPQILNMSGSSIMTTSNLPPELLERINKAQNKVNRHSTYNFETSSGGFIPYHSMTRRATSLGATALSTNADVAQITEASHWLTRNQVRFAYMAKKMFL